MRPLADEIRPQTLDEVAGQKHLLGEGALLRRLIESGAEANLIFYGPSGTGKTTIASIIARLAAGLALMGAQLGALILGGLFLRFWPLREESAPRPRAGDFKDAIGSILGVCGNMVVFSVGAALLTQFLSGAPRVAVRMVAELAMGMQAGSGAGLPLPLLGALAGFTGVCIVWQNAAVLRDCGIGMRALLPVKLLHALFCFALCLPASAIPGPAQAVFAPAQRPATVLLPNSAAALTLLALASGGNLWYNRKRTL